MTEAFFNEMIVLAGTATGMVLLGLARLLAGGRSLGLRTATTVGCVAAPAGGLVALGLSGPAATVAGVVGLVALGAAVLRSGRLAEWLSAAVRYAGRTGIQSAGLSVGGGALLIAGLGRYEGALEGAADRDMAAIEVAAWKPPMHVRTDAAVATDKGRPVTLHVAAELREPAVIRAAEQKLLGSFPSHDKLIRVAPPSDVCNCHGWVFTGGRYWLGPDDVQRILEDNAYQPVSDPRPGDLVIYDDGMKISHTAVVKAVVPGGPVLVEGKWGWMGVFLHAVDSSCYGDRVTYFRGPRTSHVLAGLAPAPPAQSPVANLISSNVR